MKQITHATLMTIGHRLYDFINHIYSAILAHTHIYIWATDSFRFDVSPNTSFQLMKCHIHATKSNA